MNQVPKDILCGNCKHKSHWALFLIVIIVIIFGLFWLVEAPTKITPVPVAPITQNHLPAKNPTSDLEASVGAIDIPDYSSSL